MILLSRLRTLLLRRLGMPTFCPTYDEDGLYTNHSCDFLQDERFTLAYDRAWATGSSEGWHHRWRIHTLLWSAEVCKRIPGDYVECGTYLGAAAAAVTSYLDFGSLARTLWLCDTFTGLPNDDALRYRYRESDYQDRVARTFAEYHNVRLVKGRLPGSLAEVPIDRVAWLHIDCGVPETEVGCLRELWGRLTPGGLVVLNTYAYPGYEDCKREYDRFAKEIGIGILYCPTGQGLIVRR